MSHFPYLSPEPLNQKLQRQIAFGCELKNNSPFFQTTGTHFLCGSGLRRVQTRRERDCVIREGTAHALRHDMISDVWTPRGHIVIPSLLKSPSLIQ